ncbi:HoxN/HupN/NixA family nickel/cobalt transporter [Brevibacterium oceani]|uniref:HoxN/HupN/NixA family nickel/cobalt transporter n=1 Tax=Brevibacterium oceani TaxID=358099 RepID=UPI0015E6F7D2|nr:high frequency lysogenization protein HflD [Brevibacterium oceani]
MTRAYGTMLPHVLTLSGIAIIGVFLVIVSLRETAPSVAWGLALTAVLLGARHAFDADHIAAIDNVTRRLSAKGTPAGTVGFWFSLGHSSVVVVTGVFVAFGAGLARDLVLAEDSAARFGLGLWGLSFATFVVAVFGIVNLVSLIGLLRRKDDEAGSAPDGPLTIAFARLLRAVDRPRRMFPIGVLFGLGFDTAATIGLMIAAGTTAAGSSAALALSLPLLFAVGMAVCDTADSLFMSNLYGWASRGRNRFRRYNIVITGLSVVVAGLVVIAGVVEVGAETETFALPEVDTSYLGIVATALFALIAVAAALTVRRVRGARSVEASVIA